MAETVRVKGLREFQRALKSADKATRKEVRAALRESGELVRTEAASRFERYDADTAAGFRVAVRARGVAVEQKKGRTTGQHPEFGSLQMRRALLPATEDKQAEIMAEFEKALDKIADILERG